MLGDYQNSLSKKRWLEGRIIGRVGTGNKRPPVRVPNSAESSREGPPLYQLLLRRGLGGRLQPPAVTGAAPHHEDAEDQ